MIADPYAHQRASLEESYRKVEETLRRSFEPRWKLCGERGDDEGLARSVQTFQLQLAEQTRPIVAALASLPPPPMVVPCGKVDRSGDN